MIARAVPPVFLDLDRTVIRGVGTRILARNVPRQQDEYVRLAMALMEPLAKRSGKPLLPRSLARQYIEARRAWALKQRRDPHAETPLYAEGEEHLFFCTPTRITDCAEFGLFRAWRDAKISGTDFKRIRDRVLEGMTKQQLQLAQEEVETAINTGVKEFVDWYKSIRGIVLIATNTWKPLAQAVAKAVGVGLVVGDEPEFSEGAFTGNVEFVGNKWDAALKLLEQATGAERNVLAATCGTITDISVVYAEGRSSTVDGSRTPRFVSVCRIRDERRAFRTPPDARPRAVSVSFIAVDDSPSQLADAQKKGAFAIGINVPKRDRNAAKSVSLASDWTDLQVLVSSIIS
ncbi:haloacid dehalogenase-like hydrolase [Candidatus Micrarchaeota archaeon]|nr:haloacid dehalogenase-like hydrolase [Candidatus Micrarchaeota archaeon]